MLTFPHNDLYSGRYELTIDQKNRIIMPAKFREELGGTFVLAPGIDRCITVYPVHVWKSRIEKLDTLPSVQTRHIKRFILSYAQEICCDSQGRFLVPQFLRDYAGIEKYGIITGLGDILEIWSDSMWKEEEKFFSNEEMTGILKELGF